MRSKHIAAWLLALCSLASCSKDTPSSDITDKSQEASLAVSMEVGTAIDSTEAKTVFTIKKDKGNGRGPALYSLPEKLSGVHFILRRKGAPKGQCTHFTADLTRNSSTGKYVLSSANVNIPTNPDPSTAEWYIAGCIGGTWTDGDISFETQQRNNYNNLSYGNSSTARIEMPYTLPWTRIYIRSNGPGKYKADRIYRNFHQQGSLFRVSGRNNSGVDIQVKSFKVTSNVLGFNGRFSFSTMPTNEGWQPWFDGIYVTEYQENFVNAFTVGNGQDIPYFFFWGQNLDWPQGQEAQTTVTLYSEENCQGTAYELYTTKQKTGTQETGYHTTYKVYGNIDPIGDDMRVPLAWVAEYNVQVSKTNRNTLTFLNTWENKINSDERARLGWKQFKVSRLRIPDWIEPLARSKGYKLPTPYEWDMIFPRVPDNNSSANGFDGPNMNFAHHVTVKGDVAYAIRMEGNGNTYRCAYRYYFGDNPDGQGQRIAIVEGVYLGGDLSINIDQVANPSWWQGKRIVKRYFPLGGSEIPKEDSPTIGNTGFYASTEHYARYGQTGGFERENIGEVLVFGKLRGTLPAWTGLIQDNPTYRGVSLRLMKQP